MSFFLRSFLFIPSNIKKILDKFDTLKPDAFVLDLEDGVPKDQKIQARENIKNKLEKIDLSSTPKLFIRINSLDTEYVHKDIEETINPKIFGYMIPKFEDFQKLQKVMNFILEQEREKNIKFGKIKLILMVETPKGVIELGKLNNLSQRIMAITIGWEDFTKEITVFSEIIPDMLNFIRMNILLYAKANDLLTIDTIYKNFSDNEGLKNETIKVVKMGFNGKLAIHPRQIDIINSCFTPTEEEIKRMNVILKNKYRIEKEGAIDINGVMYDPPHLKWALKVKEYLNGISRKD